MNKKKKQYNVLLLATAGLIIAVEIILERYLSIEPGDTNRYSLAFVARAVAGVILGPLGAGAAGVIADCLGAIIKFGSPIWLLCISAFLRGYFYGVFLHKKTTVIRIIVSVLCVEGICSVVLNSLILHFSFHSPLSALLISRGIQAVIMTAVQIPVLILMNQYLFPQLRRIFEQYKQVNAHAKENKGSNKPN